MRDYRNLTVWKKAHNLTLSVYSATRRFPATETYGLRAQVRSALCAIESNIAEGAGRRTRPDYARFLDIAMGSTNETECQLMIARDLSYLSEAIADALLADLNDVRMMLLGLRRKIVADATKT